VKSANKRTIYISLTFVLVVIILLGSVFLKLHNEKEQWKHIVAEHNYNHWNEIYHMAWKTENQGFTKDAIKESYLYINAKIYSNTDGLYPVFSGDSKYTAFLQTYYYGLAQDIAVKDMQGDKLQEALDLFKETTIELKKLSGNILNIAENKRASLIETKSELYNQVEKTIIEFCNKYGEKISTFNLSV